MVENREIAFEINNRALEVSRLMNEIVVIAQAECSSEEMRVLKLAVGRVLGELLFEILNPLYRAHSELKPDGF